MKTPTRSITFTEPIASTNRAVAELLGTAINLLNSQARTLGNFNTGVKRRSDRTMRGAVATRRRTNARRRAAVTPIRHTGTTIRHAGTAKKVAA
jgi:hypothetical protein